MISHKMKKSDYIPSFVASLLLLTGSLSLQASALITRKIDSPKSDATTKQKIATNALVVPTISITEIITPIYTGTIGEPTHQTINIAGVNLTQDISIAISGTDANQFSISQPTITHTGGTIPNTLINISYNPLNPGQHNATITLSSAGAISYSSSLIGSASWVALSTPLAIDASSINPTTFTANWNTVSGATDYQLDVYTKTQGNALTSDLFISEYIEGLSNNKAIEIYNGTGASVNLSEYSIMKQSNGAGSYSSAQTLSGTLAHNNVFISANTAASSAILNLANTTNSTAISFNGNDAVALYKSGVKIDEVGIFNQSADWGKDLTLIRKSSISSPKATYSAADWDIKATDYIANLGSHVLAATSDVNTAIAGSPFYTSGTNKVLTDLTPGKTYYYTVTARNTNVTSEKSNIISLTTSVSGVHNPKILLEIKVKGGNISFTANEKETVEVFDTMGQLLLQKQATAGINTLALTGKGIRIIKVGNRIAKAIL